MSDYKPQAVTDQDFQRQVLESDKPVLVDFWADWCGPCRAVAPLLDRLAQEYGDRVAIRKLDVDANPRTARDYGIRSIPTLMVFRNGRVVETVVGVHPMQRLTELIEARAP